MRNRIRAVCRLDFGRAWRGGRTGVSGFLVVDGASGPSGLDRVAGVEPQPGVEPLSCVMLSSGVFPSVVPAPLDPLADSPSPVVGISVGVVETEGSGVLSSGTGVDDGASPWSGSEGVEELPVGSSSEGFCEEVEAPPLSSGSSSPSPLPLVSPPSLLPLPPLGSVKSPSSLR